MQTERAKTGLSGEITIPGDKSVSHRALILGALALGETKIRGLSVGEDVLHLMKALRLCGVKITGDDEGTWYVAGRGTGGLAAPDDVLDMGNSGTAARLLCGVLAAHPFVSFMTGDQSLRSRPMRRVTAPLKMTGASFLSAEGGTLPLAIKGTGQPLPVSYQMPVASAQVKSALLLAGLQARGETLIIEPVASRDHTERMLRFFGADLRSETEGAGRRIYLQGPVELTAQEVDVIGDFSSAAFFMVAALLIPGSDIKLKNVGMNPLRTGLWEVLTEMGADITLSEEKEVSGEKTATLWVRYSALHGVRVGAERFARMADEYPVLAVAAALASGETLLEGLAELRVKESDRLAATAALLAKNGVEVRVTGDSLLIKGCGGAPPGGGFVQTFFDHRIAMSAFIFGQVCQKGIGIDSMESVKTSFPEFLTLAVKLGICFPSAAKSGSEQVK